VRRRLRSNGIRPPVDWQEQAQFFALAASAMRRFRAARAKDRRARRFSLFTTTEVMENMDALDDLLVRLESLDPRQAQIVEMRYFGGLTIEQTAQALGIPDDTVKREWTHARAWLRYELSQRPS
jgi:RNA polymerase sigma-70 factor (ECF subfamily)